MVPKAEQAKAALEKLKKEGQTTDTITKPPTTTHTVSPSQVIENVTKKPDQNISFTPENAKPAAPAAPATPASSSSRKSGGGSRSSQPAQETTTTSKIIENLTKTQDKNITFSRESAKPAVPGSSNITNAQKSNTSKAQAAKANLERFKSQGATSDTPASTPGVTHPEKFKQSSNMIGPAQTTRVGRGVGAFFRQLVGGFNLNSEAAQRARAGPSIDIENGGFESLGFALGQAASVFSISRIGAGRAATTAASAVTGGEAVAAEVAAAGRATSTAARVVAAGEVGVAATTAARAATVGEVAATAATTGGRLATAATEVGTAATTAVRTPVAVVIGNLAKNTASLAVNTAGSIALSEISKGAALSIVGGPPVTSGDLNAARFAARAAEANALQGDFPSLLGITTSPFAFFAGVNAAFSTQKKTYYDTFAENLRSQGIGESDIEKLLSYEKTRRRVLSIAEVPGMIASNFISESFGRAAVANVFSLGGSATEKTVLKTFIRTAPVIAIGGVAEAAAGSYNQQLFRTDEVNFNQITTDVLFGAAFASVTGGLRASLPLAKSPKGKIVANALGFSLNVADPYEYPVDKLVDLRDFVTNPRKTATIISGPGGDFFGTVMSGGEGKNLRIRVPTFADIFTRTKGKGGSIPTTNPTTNPTSRSSNTFTFPGFGFPSDSDIFVPGKDIIPSPTDDKVVIPENIKEDSKVPSPGIQDPFLPVFNINEQINTDIFAVANFTPIPITTVPRPGIFPPLPLYFGAFGGLNRGSKTRINYRDELAFLGGLF